LLIRHRIKHEEPPFMVEAYHVSLRRDLEIRRGDEGKSICEATIKVRVGDQVAHTVAQGDGPVNALDSALRAALIKFFPQLDGVKLTDYKVRILEAEWRSGLKQAQAELQKVPPAGKLEIDTKVFEAPVKSGTAAKTRVLIESSDGKREWGTVGVSENIIEASLQALIDSMEYALTLIKE
jgi:2-isopropylmalate synthase